MKTTLEEDFQAGMYSGLSGYTDRVKAQLFTVSKCSSKLTKAYWLGVRCGLTRSGKWGYDDFGKPLKGKS